MLLSQIRYFRLLAATAITMKYAWALVSINKTIPMGYLISKEVKKGGQLSYQFSLDYTFVRHVAR